MSQPEFKKPTNKYLIKSTTGPICLDWIRPFVDSQRIAIFQGLGVTSAVYGESAPPQNPFLMANFPPIEGAAMIHLKPPLL